MFGREVYRLKILPVRRIVRYVVNHNNRLINSKITIFMLKIIN